MLSTNAVADDDVAIGRERFSLRFIYNSQQFRLLERHKRLIRPTEFFLIKNSFDSFDCVQTTEIRMLIEFFLLSANVLDSSPKKINLKLNEK